MKYKDITESEEVDFDRKMGRYDPEEDDMHKQKRHNTRMPKMTLRIINRMKKMHTTRKLEVAQQRDIYSIMFNPPAEEGGGDMGGGGGLF